MEKIRHMLRRILKNVIERNYMQYKVRNIFFKKGLGLNNTSKVKRRRE
jgi:hypothetical protein